MVALDAGDRPLRLTAPRPVFEHPAERRSARMEENRCKDVPEVKKASEHKSGRGEHGNVVAIDAGDRPLRLTAPRPVLVRLQRRSVPMEERFGAKLLPPRTYGCYFLLTLLWIGREFRAISIPLFS